MTGIKEALEKLIWDYVTLLESGRDRIISLGGECDAVDVMEAGSPALNAAKAALAQLDSADVSSDRYRLVNYLERLPSEKIMIGGEMVDVVKPQYLLASDRDDITAIFSTGLLPDASGKLTVPFNPCLAKLRDDEPFFVLLGRDKQAPIAVIAWADAREQAEGKSEWTDQAREVAATMAQYSGIPMPDASPGNGAVTSSVVAKIEEARDLFWDIKGDFSDPRAECRRGADLLEEVLTALHSTSAAGETTSSDGAESQREVQAQMGPAKTKASPSALGAGDRPSEAIPADVIAKPTQEYVLRAMAKNYQNGNSWDDLDRETVIAAADEIKTLHADVLAMKEACKRAVTELDCMYVNDVRVPYGGIPADPESSAWREAIKAAEAAIDKLSPEVKDLNQ